MKFITLLKCKVTLLKYEVIYILSLCKIFAEFWKKSEHRISLNCIKLLFTITNIKEEKFVLTLYWLVDWEEILNEILWNKNLHLIIISTKRRKKWNSKTSFERIRWTLSIQKSIEFHWNCDIKRSIERFKGELKLLYIKQKDNKLTSSFIQLRCSNINYCRCLRGLSILTRTIEQKGFVESHSREEEEWEFTLLIPSPPQRCREF